MKKQRSIAAWINAVVWVAIAVTGAIAMADEAVPSGPVENPAVPTTRSAGASVESAPVSVQAPSVFSTRVVLVIVSGVIVLAVSSLLHKRLSERGAAS
jgi:hypothetical protein